MRGLLRAAVILLLLLLLWEPLDHGAGGIVEGLIFHDVNANGVHDSGEEGLAGVLVSDGAKVVVTTADGSYRLSLGNDRGIIFITIPSGWWTDNFYRHLGSGVGLDFPLYPIGAPQEFTFIQVTDIHITREAVEAVEEFVARVNQLDPQPVFVISTGDLVFDVCYYTNTADTLEEVEGAFDLYREAMSGLAQPLFNVIGNHDCACALPPHLPEYYKGAYQKLFGPLWYSFDYGRWHFVVLDGNAPQPLPTNWLSEEELEWLERDLTFQPEDRPIILFSHQPLFYCRNYKRLLEIVEGYNVKVALAGHEHATYAKERGILNIVTGALSGRWWADDGIHWNGHNTDGSPQGFRICWIDEEIFSSAYVAMKSEP